MFSKDFLNEEVTYQLKNIAEMENEHTRDYWIYKTGNSSKNKTFDYQKFRTVRSFKKEIYNNDLSLDDDLQQLIKKMILKFFQETAKPKKINHKIKKNH